MAARRDRRRLLRHGPRGMGRARRRLRPHAACEVAKPRSGASRTPRARGRRRRSPRETESGRDALLRRRDPVKPVAYAKATIRGGRGSDELTSGGRRMVMLLSESGRWLTGIVLAVVVIAVAAVI